MEAIIKTHHKSEKLKVVDDFAGFKRVRLLFPQNKHNRQAFYNRIERARKDAGVEGYGIVYITTHMIDRKTGQVKFLNIDFAKFFNNSRQFSRQVTQLLTKGSTGSAVSKEEFRFDYNNVDLLLVKRREVRAVEGVRVEKRFFKVMNLGEYKEGLCGWRCLIIAGDDIGSDEYQSYKLKELKKMMEYISSKELQIDIVGNHVNFNNYDFKYKLNSDGKKWDNNGYGERFQKLEMKDTQLSYLYRCEGVAKYTMIYDYNKSHMDITKKLELDNIFVDYSDSLKKLIPGKGMKEMFTNKQQLEQSNKYGFFKPPVLDEEEIVFDLETYTDYDYNCVNKPYSISWTHFKRGSMEDLDEIEKSKNEIDLKLFIERNSHFEFGEDCVEKFINYILENQNKKLFRLVSFNGVNFDNYILYNECRRLGIEGVDSPLLCNGQMLNFKISGRHSMIDVRKFTIGSLKKNCEDHKIELCAKREGFSHYEMQLKANKGEIWDFIHNTPKVQEYNVYDTLATALVWHRLRAAYLSIGFNPSDFLTLGSAVMTSMETHINNKRYRMPNIESLSWYKNIQKNRVAGRCELFNGVKKLNKTLRSLDVCSLYPYIMFIAPVYYPAGKCIELACYTQKPQTFIGFFECTKIDQSNMEYSIVPNKTKEGSNDWEAKIIEASEAKPIILSSIMIDYINSHGGHVEVGKGIYFDEKIRSFDLFQPLADIMKKKNEQDAFKKSKSTSFNASLREAYKLYLNILSGKFNQGLFVDQRKIMNDQDFETFINSNKYESINVINRENDGMNHVSYKLDEKDALRKAKPIAIGNMIYDYARIYMHENAYSIVPRKHGYYTDTDSFKIDKRGMEDFVKKNSAKIVPHWIDIEKYDPRYKTHKIYERNSKVFGSFEDEYEGLNSDLCYFLQKKCYLVIDSAGYTEAKMRGENGDEYVKFCFKGISDRDVWLPDDFDDKDVKNLAGIHNILSNPSLGDDSPKYKRICDDYLAFFEYLYKNKTAKILTFSMKKTHNNSKKNTKPDQKDRHQKYTYTVSSNYVLKNITIDEEDHEV